MLVSLSYSCTARALPVQGFTPVAAVSLDREALSTPTAAFSEDQRRKLDDICEPLPPWHARHCCHHADAGFIAGLKAEHSGG
jgi:hypothetical protein